MVDSFSKFVWMYPTNITGADEVLKKLREWSDVFGNPARIVSDRGAAFTSSSFEEFVKEKNIEHIWSTTGEPRGNGQIERVNRSILSIISKLSSEEPGRCYKFVPRVQRAINSTVHVSTKRCPFELMIGVKMRCGPDSDILQLIEKEMVVNFEDERQKMRQEAKENIQQAQDRYKEQFDKKRKCEYEYKVGDLVAIRRTQFVTGRKMASEFLGPYEITNVKRGGRYNVRKAADAEGPSNTTTSNDNMKLWSFSVENEDAWSSGTDD
ncbi:uncharacterized protein K02A2.6-like [Drosophila miranda]|uniref:uncharacterized protein K02A2.6-like n=1 Tax=Drosophila miranda TaxID=7229 RepID=UPI00143F512D|nr:uncharacterized protein K02A2.6-like [Drosophila miranda]